MDMITKIENMKKSFDSDLKSAKGLKELEDLRQKYLSRKGQLAILFDDLKNVSPREKPQLGKSLNALKNHMQEGFNSLLNSLQLDHQRSGRQQQSADDRRDFDRHCDSADNQKFFVFHNTLASSDL